MGLNPKECGSVHREERQTSVVVLFYFPSGAPVGSMCGRFTCTRKLDVKSSQNNESAVCYPPWGC